MIGWVKLHRKLITWEWAASPTHTALFVHIILRANYKISRWRGTDLSPGQLVTGRKQLMEWTGLTEKQTRNCLEDLENSNEIGRRRAGLFSVITITNWDSYQGEGQERAEERPAKVQRRATSNKVIIKEVKNSSELECLVIDYYNQANDRNIKQGDTNYKEIRARLKEGHTAEDMKQLIDYAAKNWNGDPFWNDKNRPSTLFSGKFDGYLQIAKDSFKPKIDPLMALAKKHLGDSVFSDSKEEN
jgi:uncharacterized phage protein (TIGR02220 family)